MASEASGGVESPLWSELLRKAAFQFYSEGSSYFYGRYCHFQPVGNLSCAVTKRT